VSIWTKRFNGSIVSATIILVGLLSVYPIENYIDQSRPAINDGWVDEDLALNGGRMKGFVLGTEGLMADWYWMRSLQYVGKKLVSARDDQVNIEDLRPLNPRLLYPYLDTATDLDPKFIAAYTYGAVVLPAIDPELAIKLTKKGIDNNPESWRFYQYLGYIYWRLGRFNEASDAYAKGAAISGAPAFMQLMAAAMKTQAGSRETAREIYGQMARDEGDAQTQYYAQFRLMWIDSLDEQDGIRSALKSFQERSGRCAGSWNELFPYLKNVTLPHGRSLRVDAKDQVVDPSGVPYIIDQQKCDVHLNYLETKVPTR
jgi:tetratricopeptide (TPR) repeat protein